MSESSTSVRKMLKCCYADNMHIAKYAEGHLLVDIAIALSAHFCCLISHTHRLAAAFDVLKPQRSLLFE